MATRKTTAKKKTSKSKTTKARKPSAKRKTGRRARGGPLVEVARKIGSTLGEVAVRTGIVKPGGAEPTGE